MEEIERAAAEYKELVRKYRASIFVFIKDTWELTPQPCKPAYQERWNEVIASKGTEWLRLKDTVRAEWFGECVDERTGKWIWYAFEKGKHITWQQTLILLAINKAMQDTSGSIMRKLSVVSGHGIGKSATMSWFVLWFLFCFIGAQVPVTAPTATQMHDVLWKEMSIWINRMPPMMRGFFVWQSDYVRITMDPNAWFARARTSTKENTEAIAGVHAEDVAVAVDEASGVPRQVFDTAEGSLTNANTLIVMISNGTDVEGYFYDSHNKDKEMWQRFSFNGEESPIVDRKYVEMKLRHGRESDEYKIRVRGMFPGEGQMDDSGYLKLLPTERIVTTPVIAGLMFGRIILGVDPSGEGRDKATWVIRNRFRAQKVMELKTTNARQIAEITLTLMDKYKIDPYDVVVDSLGEGTDVGKEVALASTPGKRLEIYTVLVGNAAKGEAEYNSKFFTLHPDEVENPNDKFDEWVDLFLNIRALMYFRARDWMLKGGTIADDKIGRAHV